MRTVNTEVRTPSAAPAHYAEGQTASLYSSNFYICDPTLSFRQTGPVFEYLTSVTRPEFIAVCIAFVVSVNIMVPFALHLFYKCATPSPAASTCLTLREIENELSEVTGEDWYPLGVQLGLRPATLREIQKNYPRDTERCKSEVLHLWLCTTPQVSWKTLAQAVQGLGGYTSLAQKLRRKIPPAPKG